MDTFPCQRDGQLCGLFTGAVIEVLVTDDYVKRVRRCRRCSATASTLERLAIWPLPSTGTQESG